MGENEQGLLLHVQNAISVDPGVRRKGHIDEQRDREVVTLRAHREMDAIERAAAGAEIAARADQGIYVEIVGRLALDLSLPVVGWTVDIDHLRHCQNLLEAIENERVALGAILALARSEALVRVGIKRLLPTWRLRIVIVALGRHCRTGPAIAPQRTGQHWPIAWRRFRRQLAGPDYDRPQHTFW